MLGNPPVPPYGMELGEDNGEVENYEVSIYFQSCPLERSGNFRFGLASVY